MHERIQKLDKFKMSCLRPRTAINRYSGERFVVNCGTCKACLMRLSRSASYKCELEEKDHKYAMFVTLTYSNDNVPLAVAQKVGQDFDIAEYGDDEVPYVSNTCHYELHDVTPRFLKERDDFGNHVADAHLHPFQLEELYNKFKYFDRKIPYLSRVDAQRFIKRFRKHLSKFSDEKIKYYLVGEYGPVHFRPHFHVVFYFDNEKTLSSFGQVLHKSWTFGRVDYSLSRSKVSSYVAGYVNSRSSIPRIYSDRSIRPFSLHSTSFALGLFKGEKEKVYEYAPYSFDDACHEIFSSDVSVYPWRSLVSLFFPKVRRFSSSDSRTLRYAYLCSENLLENCKVDSVRDLTNLVLNHFVRAFNTDNKNDRTISNYDSGIPALNNFLIYVNSTTLIYDHYDEPCQLYQFDWSNIYDYVIKTLKSAITSIYYTSKHFIEFCCDSDPSLYTYRIKQIREFYSHLDYYRLKNQLSEQSAWINDDTVNYLYYWYDNCPLQVDDDGTRYFVLSDYQVYLYQILQDSPFYLDFLARLNIKFENSVKHKALNDLNHIFE